MGSATDSDLIDLIYAAMLGETDWQAFLVRLGETMPEGKTTLFYHDVAGQRGACELTSGFDSEIVTRYASFYSRVNPWMPHVATRQIGLGVVAEGMVPREQLVRTEFYNDFFRKHLGESAVGMTIMRESGRALLLSIMTSRADADRNMDDADRLSRLFPHLRRALGHLRKSSSAVPMDEIGGRLFAEIGIGTLFVDEDTRIRSASTIGRQMLENGDAVRLTPSGRVKLETAEADAALRSMLHRTSMTGKVARFVVGHVSLTLIRIDNDTISGLLEGPTVVVLLEPAGPKAADLELLARHYGLTPGEARVLTGILAGKSIDMIAQEARRSRETIRTQLRSVFEKTGARSQVELVRLVTYPLASLR